MPKTAIAAASTKKPAIAERKVAVERPHKGLTQTQEEMADIASDILLNGGAQGDVNLMLTALMRHRYRHMSFSRSRYAVNAVDVDKSANEFASRFRDKTYRDLAKHWPEKKTEPTDNEAQSAPRPVTEMVRSDIRASAQEQFDQFLTDKAGIEPAWLLNEVLENCNSNYDLAEAFCVAIQSQALYVRVPWEHKERIEEFVAFLQKEDAA